MPGEPKALSREEAEEVLLSLAGGGFPAFAAALRATLDLERARRVEYVRAGIEAASETVDRAGWMPTSNLCATIRALDAAEIAERVKP